MPCLTHTRSMATAGPVTYAATLLPSQAPVGLRPPSARDGQNQPSTSTSDNRSD
jgi:hypothetical protein